MKLDNYIHCFHAYTILKTENINNKIIDLYSEKYHFGLRSKLLLKLNQNNFEGDKINILINIDELLLPKSQFWSILIKIDKSGKVEPFLISMYHGESKSNNSNMFLLRFIEKMKILQEEGLNFNNKIVKVIISKVLYDFHAKSFTLCIKNFNSYQSCTKVGLKEYFKTIK